MSERLTATEKAAYRSCAQLTTGHYENFPIASILLPRDVRRHMYALYAFARGVDDLGDEAEGDRLALLDRWEAGLRWALQETEAPPGEIPAAFAALRASHRLLDFPLEPFLRLIEANRRDQRILRHATYDDLLTYCTYSADPVGRLVLHIFGYRDPDLWPLSDATCTALQLTNFWQDVSRDHAMGRIFLPQEDMERFGVTEETIAAGEVSGGFRDLMVLEVGRARDLFREGKALIGRVRGRFRLDLALFTRGGEAVLDAIEAADYDVLSSRPVLSSGRKFRLLLEAVSGCLRGASA